MTDTTNTKQNVWDFFVGYIADEPTTEENHEAKSCVHNIVKQMLEDTPEASPEMMNVWDDMTPVDPSRKTKRNLKNRTRLDM